MQTQLSFDSPMALVSFLQTLATSLGIEIDVSFLAQKEFEAEMKSPGVKTAIDTIIANFDAVFPKLNIMIKPFVLGVLTAIDAHL